MGGALLVAVYLLVWWVLASAASRRHGAAVFALGLLLLAAAGAAYRRGHRRWLYRLCYASLLAAAAALLLEAALRLRPGLLGGRVANFAYSGYHPYRGGIYSFDAHLGQRMRPAVRRWMYWNGHWWWHEANALGWRGPALDGAQAAFLGDSMIYGHGVAGHDTVPAAFARRSGLATANLGQQGTCAPQQLLILRERAAALRPRVVLLCAHPSDLEDLERTYDETELRLFLEEPQRPLRVRPELGPRPAGDPLWLWARHVGLPLRSGGVLGSLVRSLRERRFREFPAARDPFVPTASEQAEVPAPLRAEASAREGLAWGVHALALREVGRECEAMGARLVLFDLGYPRAFSEAVESLARDLGVEYSPAGRVALQRALAGEHVYLANDGHWSATGAAIVAEELARTRAVQAIMHP